VKDLFEDVPNIESKYFKSALEYVKNDAYEIVEYIKNLLEERKKYLQKLKIV
jgi:pyrroloquinoline quinone (PQQ) biosynthesis protein C